ncbi:flagellar export protein FliJ [Blastococcus sp. TF02A-26]|uniref:flagellar export protein FliJ n=1 Tax=Blastococcus sp. TF02A-26 TaxID=2250577 RepID=UPI000DEB31BC|nr:flagellar export protein FliJ [Blastococcus sp. TF02A-26]RBY86066.1 flagellar export protein FliJ [Blastococcus sp. TF02A-26]
MGKRQAFRLAPVLRVREAAQRAASLAYAEAESAAADAARRADRLAGELHTWAVTGSHSSQSFLAAMVASQAAAADVSAARSTAQASAEHAELLRARWTAAAQETKALEKLRDRHELALRHAEDAAETRAVDDLVTGRHSARTARDEQGEEGTWRG